MNAKTPIYTDINQILQEPFSIEDSFSAFDCLKEARYLSTGLEELDDLLRGGIPNFGLTEVFGKSSSGKTQFALQLCLQCQLPLSLGGLGKGSIYISTDQPFPSERLFQLAEHFLEKYKPEVQDWGSEFSVQDLCSNIHAIRANSIEKHHHVIESAIPQFLKSHSIGLVIIDSIAGNFKDITDRKERAQKINQLSKSLRQLGMSHKLAIVCINQIVDVISNEDNSDNDLNYFSDDNTDYPNQNQPQIIKEYNPLNTSLFEQLYAPLKINYMPALGPAWSSQVNTRILFARKLQQNHRKAILINKSVENSKGVNFTIEHSGLIQID